MQKNIIIFATRYLLCIALFFIQCKNTTARYSSGNSICIQGRLSYAASVGYGDIYLCQVLEVSAGKLAADTIHISIVDSSFQKFFKNTYAIDKAELCFEKQSKKVPYHLMPINGFVDKNMYAYKLISIQ